MTDGSLTSGVGVLSPVSEAILVLHFSAVSWSPAAMNVFLIPIHNSGLSRSVSIRDLHAFTASGYNPDKVMALARSLTFSEAPLSGIYFSASEANSGPSGIVVGISLAISKTSPSPSAIAIKMPANVGPPAWLGSCESRDLQASIAKDSEPLAVWISANAADAFV